MKAHFAALACIALFVSGCGKKKVRTPVPPPVASIPATTPVPLRAAPPPATVSSTERGIASWYGNPYHGRAAADGEIYDMETLVAAHRTLPFQTMVRVRNLANDKTVDVRIIDRGPFAAGRIIDLSHAAAKQVEMIGPGTAQVELTIISAPPSTAPAQFGVQVGAFREKGNADRYREQLNATYGSAREVARQGDPVLWRVVAGRELSLEAAETLAQRIRREQNVPLAFVVRLDP